MVYGDAHPYGRVTTEASVQAVTGFENFNHRRIERLTCEAEKGRGYSFSLSLGRSGIDAVALSISADDKRWETTKTGQSLSYKPDIKDLQIAGDWAFEWGYFDASYKESANAAPLAVRGKQLRILKRQQDGSWRFARVMSVIDSRGPAEIKK